LPAVRQERLSGWQTPPVQLWEQQAAGSEQSPPSLVQSSCAQWPSMQDRPQHSTGLEQVLPGGAHKERFDAQVPDATSQSPEQQSAPVSQREPSGPSVQVAGPAPTPAKPPLPELPARPPPPALPLEPAAPAAPLAPAPPPLSLWPLEHPITRTRAMQPGTRGRIDRFMGHSDEGNWLNGSERGSGGAAIPNTTTDVHRSTNPGARTRGHQRSRLRARLASARQISRPPRHIRPPDRRDALQRHASATRLLSSDRLGGTLEA